MAFEFGGLIEYFTRKIFKEKKKQKCAPETSSRSLFQFF